MVYEFFLDGHVVPKARPRVTRLGTFMPENYRDWMATATAELICQNLSKKYGKIPVPCAIKIVLINHQKRSDIDNLAGAIMDALTKAKILKNDNLKNVDTLYVRCEKNPSVGFGARILLENSTLTNIDKK